MSENTTSVVESGNEPQETTRAFTQDDVNRIVSERLAKEKAKSEAAMVQRGQELDQREKMLVAREKVTAMGLPAELVNALNINTPEELEKSLSIIAGHIKPNITTAPAAPKGVPGVSGNPAPPYQERRSPIRDAMGLK